MSSNIIDTKQKQDLQLENSQNENRQNKTKMTKIEDYSEAAAAPKTAREMMSEATGHAIRDIKDAPSATPQDNASSDRLVSFLEEVSLHKKDFAEMIGVTLSYVYSLIDKNVPFSSRTTTLERIAAVMGIDPESFPEYKRPEEPRLVDPGVEFLKRRQGELGMSNVQFIKRFPRNQRLEIVDMWRGALPMPLDWAKLQAIASVLELGKEEIYVYWQNRMQQFLTTGGIDPLSNIGLLTAMFSGIKSYLKI